MKVYLTKEAQKNLSHLPKKKQVNVKAKIAFWKIQKPLFVKDLAIQSYLSN